MRILPKEHTRETMEGERYSDRLTYDGRWENNLYNFMRMVYPKLTIGLRVPFHLNGEDLMLKVDKELFMADKSSDKLSDKLSDKQHSVINYLKEHPYATRQELADNIENLSFASAKYQVNILCKAGLLKRIGSNKTGHWEICTNAEE